MVVGVLSSIVSAILLGGASLLWRHRAGLGLLRTTLYPRGLVRVSFAALLRVKDDDRYVLVASSTRPGFYSPPGGVFKHHGSALPALDALGFREQRFETRRPYMRADVRGFVPARSAVSFVRWFVRGEDRETATDCLRRELVEELGGTGGPSLVQDIRGLTFRRVRVVMEGPRRVPRQSYRQLRRMEVYDLVVTDEASARFRRQLLALGDDPEVATVTCADGQQIMSGWCGTRPVAPHSAYLIGPKRSLADLPPMPTWATWVG
jgi:8-oxo-dGTP pyrophosphatase MutT (NUDIX family)